MNFIENFISKKFYPNIKVIQLFLDLTFLNVSYFIAIFIRWGNFATIKLSQNSELALVLNLSWVMIILWLHVVKPVRMERISSYLFRLINTLTHHVLLIGLVIFVFKFSEISRLQILYFFIVFSFLLSLLRIGTLIILKKLRKKGFNYRNVIFVGWDAIANRFYDVIHRDLTSGYKVLGYFNYSKTENVPINFLGDITSIKNFITQNEIDELFITSHYFSEKEVADLIITCDANLIRLRFIPNINGLTNSFDVVRYGNLPAFSLRKEPMEKLVNRVIKRFFDFFFSLMVILLIFSWLFPIIAILIKLTSKGPVFFKQLRSGIDNKEFYCYKFRTMFVNSESDKIQAKKGDSRITPLGAFLRKTSMDELPQFFNVFLGSMSVVGPRPHMLLHTEQYSEHIDNFMVRHYLKPGITGWAQVNGYRGETRQIEEMENRVKYDIWYLENWNIFFDIKIILMTILNIFKGETKAY